MEVSDLDKGTRVLFVTGPERDRLYDRFSSLFEGRADVVVLKDRRRSERRGLGMAPSCGERRRHERRRRTPDWVVPPA